MDDFVETVWSEGGRSAPAGLAGKQLESRSGLRTHPAVGPARRNCFRMLPEREAESVKPVACRKVQCVCFRRSGAQQRNSSLKERDYFENAVKTP